MIADANATVEQQARALAADNRAAEPSIQRVLWFPDPSEIRLIVLTDDVPVTRDGIVRPFYFRASVEDGLNAPSAVAMLRSEEVGKLQLPMRWGNWQDAVDL